ncbi:hypothetical protein PanWU01x14_266500 [Parasponia andersonii]|uniref:Uncharacterized protein n=1 Tax=Parasponia andersonii TaxID=3476 RepID=A0A2P5B6Q6_PARAD|nr:hypothetical protein PanWU01x14_266500 [Parasponia andersonii]
MRTTSACTFDESLPSEPEAYTSPPDVSLPGYVSPTTAAQLHQYYSILHFIHIRFPPPSLRLPRGGNSARAVRPKVAAETVVRPQLIVQVLLTDATNVLFITMKGKSIRQHQLTRMSTRVLQSLGQKRAGNVDVEVAEGARVGGGGSVEAAGVTCVRAIRVCRVREEGEVVETVGRVVEWPPRIAGGERIATVASVGRAREDGRFAARAVRLDVPVLELEGF